MADEIKRGGFNFYLRFVKPLVINLPDPTDRVLAAGWIHKLRSNKSGNEELRTNYLKLLLFVLQRKRLIGPFRENPNTAKDLEEFPANLQILDVAKSLLQADEVDRRNRLRGLIAGAGDDFPAYNIECSADLLEYAAAQDIPKFGIHAYYAISNSPITTWDNVDFNYLPKGISWDKHVESDGINISAAFSSPDSSLYKSLSMSDSKSKSRPSSPKSGDRSPGKSPKRSPIKSVTVVKSPFGSEAPVETRSPPTWGSNLIEVTDPPDDTAFLSLTSGSKFADVMAAEERDLEASSSHIMQPSSGEDEETDQPEWFKTPTDKFLQQFNSISIKPGTEKSKDIIDEVNQSLLQSGRELTLSQAQANLDARYPDRRQDMPRTPPVFSKHQAIRQAGQGIQYSPQQFDISDEEFVHGPSFLEGQQYSPRQQTNIRADVRQQRLFSSAIENIEGDISLGDQESDFLIDDIADEIEEATRTPKNVQRKLKELLDEIDEMKETTPALGGIPVTTPKRSPSPGRKTPTMDYNIIEELGLFTERFPDALDSDFLDISPEGSPQKSPRVSPQKAGSPKIRTPTTRTARFRPESPPTPEKPDYDEFIKKTQEARKFLRPRKIEIMPSSSGRKIKVYTKPVKHYKPPSDLNKIDEKPEYKKDRFTDLYEKLMAEDLPGAISGVPTSPHASSEFPPALNLSPLSPRSPIDKYWADNLPDESEDMNKSPNLYESPKKIYPLQDLAVTEQPVEDAPEAFQDVEFNFDYNPIDLGATAAMEQLYEEDLYTPLSPRTPPRMTTEEIAQVFGSPQKTPVKSITPTPPPRPRPSPIPSPQFYEMENVLTPQEFKEVMEAHEYTDRFRTRDPDRRLATKLLTPGGRHISLPRQAPRPKLGTIADKPMIEDILVERDRQFPPAPPSPLTPGVPWRRPLAPGQIRIEDMPKEIQEKLAEPVAQRELKEWEKFVIEEVIKPEDKEYFMKLFNEYSTIQDELMDPDIIKYKGLREPPAPRKPPPRPVSPPPSMMHTRFGFDEDFFPKPEMRVVPPPDVILRPDDIPESWAKTREILEHAQMSQDICDDRVGPTHKAAPILSPDDGLFDTALPLIDDAEFTFESPRTRAARYRPISPPTPEKPTYEELIANAKAAKKRKRPRKMALGTGTTGGVKRYHTRPLRHYEPLAYLDRIDESPYVSPEVDWEKAKQMSLQFKHDEPQEVETTPHREVVERRRRGQPRVLDKAKPRKLKFSEMPDTSESEYLPADAFVAEEDRLHLNQLVATLPGIQEPLPEELMGHYYEHKFSQATGLMDRDIPEKHLKHQRRPLSPRRQDLIFPESPVTPPISPVKIESMYADPLNQEMMMDFPEDIEGEIEPVPDPYAFMGQMPTRFQGFEEDLIPADVGTAHEGFTGSPVRPMQQPVQPCMPCTSASPERPVSPTSPMGLDALFETPPPPDLFERYPDEHTHELWMEYVPVEYIDADQYTIDSPQKPKSPQPKTPPRLPRAPSPEPESPLPVFISPDRSPIRYTTSPSPFKKTESPGTYTYNTPPYPKYKYVMSPTRPSPYKASETPPGTPPAFHSLEASPINFAELEPFLYLPSPEYINENLDDSQLDDFDLSFASATSSRGMDTSPRTPVTTTPQTSPHTEQFSPLPSPTAISQNIANWDAEMQTNKILAGESFDSTPEDLDVSAEDIYTSPVSSPQRPCTPPAPPQPWAYEDQFASPTAEEIRDKISSHEFTERYRTRDPRRKLATKELRTTTGNKAFRLARHAPKPTLPTIYDFHETPEHMEVIVPQMPEIPSDVIWKSPEHFEHAPVVPGRRYDTGGYELSPERDYEADFIEMLPRRKDIKRNLFDEFAEDSTMQDGGVQDFALPGISDESSVHMPKSPQTPPPAFSPRMQQRMQRTAYDGSAPYADYPQEHTPPSGTRRRMRTYTPPGPAGPSPVKPSQAELKQNIEASYATATPDTMGVHTRTGYIKQVPTRPAQEYGYNLMDPIREVEDQYLTPPSGLRRARTTYTPHEERSPDKPTRAELMQKIASCYAPPTPYTMDLPTRTGYIKQMPTRPAEAYGYNRMDAIEELGEQYLTPPSGLRQHRRTYTPQATPRASPRLSPCDVQPCTYTPSPLPSPRDVWFRPTTYTPPPHLRWSPLQVTPSPPKTSTTSMKTKVSVRRQLFADSPESPTTFHTPRTPHRGGRQSPSPDLSFHTPSEMLDESDEDVFESPELTPSRTLMYETEIIYDVANAFADVQDNILDTSDIPDIDYDDENMDFQWMG